MIISALKSITRPANILAYSPADTIADSASAPTVPSLTLNSGGSSLLRYLMEVRLQTNKATWTPRIRLHLYDVEPPAINDNAALTVLWADRTKRLGAIDLPALATAGTGSDLAYASWRDIPKALILPTSTLWFRPEILDAATPDSGQIFDFTFMFDV